MDQVVILDGFDNDEAKKMPRSTWESLLAGTVGHPAYVSKKYTSMQPIEGQALIILSNNPLDTFTHWFPEGEEHKDVREAMKEQITGCEMEDDENLFALIDLLYKKYLKSKPVIVPTARSMGLKFHQKQKK